MPGSPTYAYAIGREGTLYLEDGGANSAKLTYYQMDFTGPVSYGVKELTAVREQGYLVSSGGNPILKMGDDPDPWYEISFSCMLEYQTTSPNLAEKYLLCEASGWASTRDAWPFKDSTCVEEATAVGKTIDVSIVWEDPDSCKVVGRKYTDVLFSPDNVTVADAADGTTLNATGTVYGGRYTVLSAVPWA